MVEQTVVIGCSDEARTVALTRAVAARSPVVVDHVWPLDRAITAGGAGEAAVVVLDAYPDGSALRAMADVTSARPELGVLVVGPLEPDLDVLIALASGAFGYLPSRSEPVAVAEAVAALLAGDAVLPRAVSVPLVHHLRWGGRGIVVRDARGCTVVLTNREWEVLVLLRQARSTAEIAKHLVISNGTVRSHVAALMHKLGVASRQGLALAGNAHADAPVPQPSPPHRTTALSDISAGVPRRVQ